MKKVKFVSLFVFTFMFMTILAGSQNAAYALTDDVEALLQLRPRYEYVDVSDNGKSAANALTLRTILGLKLNNILSAQGFSVYVEATDVRDFGLLDDYNSTSPIGGNNRSKYEAVIDPPITRMTQGYASYTGSDDLFSLGFGRRVIKLDNQRFVGPVGWRQMFQTFDVADFDLNLFDKKAKFYGAYVMGRRGIKDELSSTNSPRGEDSILLNSSYNILPAIKVVGYAYLLNSIHNTYGARLAGKQNFNPLKVNYVLEGAIQRDPSLDDKGAVDVDTYYYNLEAGLNYNGFILNGKYEVLGEADGSTTKGFSTPWATLHAFQGWSDALLGKAAGGDPNGIKDAILGVGYKNKEYGKLMFFYHKFDSVKNSKDFGSEYDFVYVKKVKKVKLLAKAAFYEKGNDFGSDTTKVWLMGIYNFKKIFK